MGSSSLSSSSDQVSPKMCLKSAEKTLILHLGIHRMQKPAGKPMQRALPASPSPALNLWDHILYPTERSWQPGLGSIGENSI